MFGRLPLSYAILRLFLDGRSRSASDVVAELESEYRQHKLLTVKDVDETLATAKENSLLCEAGSAMDSGSLIISYRISDYGREMLERYTG